MEMKLYKDANGKDIDPEWHIASNDYCPDLNCRGRLLYSKYYHPMKCNKCGKLWMEITNWVEVKELS
jgi:hypothetical protein